MKAVVQYLSHSRDYIPTCIFCFPFLVVITCLHHKLLHPSQDLLFNNSVVHAVYLSCLQGFVVPNNIYFFLLDTCLSITLVVIYYATEATIARVKIVGLHAEYLYILLSWTGDHGTSC